MISLVVGEWLRVRLIEWFHWIVSNPQELLVCRMTRYQDTLQHTATHCNTLQHTRALCDSRRMTHSHSLTAIRSKKIIYRHTNSTLTVSEWYWITSCSDSLPVLQCVAVVCSVLQCVAVICSVLQCVAVICSVLQCVAVICNVLQCVAVTRVLAIRTWCFTSLLWGGYD